MFLFGKKDYFKPGPDGIAPVIAFVSKSMTVPVYNVPAVVGRERGQSDVLINDATVSRKHLLIGTYDDKLTATDQGSTVGTIINGETLEPGIPYYLSEGDKVSIGKLDFVCHINRERMGKKLKLPTFIQKDTAGDTSEMSKADIAAAAAELTDDAAAQSPDLEAAQSSDLEAAAEVVKEAEQVSEPMINIMPDSEPVINLMKEPELDESDEQDEAEAAGSEASDEQNEDDQTAAGSPDEQEEQETAPEDPVSELEAMGLEFGEKQEPEEVPEAAQADASIDADQPAGKTGNEDASSVKAGDSAAASDDTGVLPAETIDVMRGEHARVKAPSFVYYSGHTAVESFKITATPFVVGRARSDYTPGAAGVSRRHCFIDRTGSTYYITDLESTNGVWINGRRIKPYNRTALENGDIVGIGDRVYKYEQE